MNENGAYFSWLNVSWWIENQDLILTISQPDRPSAHILPS